MKNVEKFNAFDDCIKKKKNKMQMKLLVSYFPRPKKNNKMKMYILAFYFPCCLTGTCTYIFFGLICIG